MFNEIIKEIEWGGKTLRLETGKIARQADAAVVATIGKTKVLCAVTAGKKLKEDIDFFPLTVTYIEKAYAAGKIPGGFFKREGRPSEGEILTSRLIDRPIRPLFQEGFRHEIQVVCTVLSHDGENESDIVAMIAASAALSFSGLPFEGPIAGARVALINNEFILNPTLEQISDETNLLDLIVAGTKDSVLMVESEASCLTEEKMLEAVVFGHKEMAPVINAIEEMKTEVKNSGKETFSDWQIMAVENEELSEEIAKLAKEDLIKAYQEKAKSTRRELIQVTKEKVIANLTEKNYEEKEIVSFFKKLEQEIVRLDILENQSRIDGRNPEQVRQIETEIELLPTTHGSALFTRGETQAIVVTTLGSAQDEQIQDKLSGESKANFMLHYNFPPYSVGEAYPLKPPGRREIGHGKLAFRSLKHVMPKREEFPYTVRVVSEITESNGSSSMATVCGASLAMMDSGVPLKSPVAGIAMGLVKDGEKFTVLSDIMGDEDHLGDMDFKVAGTKDGITALQMDIKIKGINPEIMQKALSQAKDGRIHILGEMEKSISSSRVEINSNAPKIDKIIIHKDKIRDVIGSGGKIIREICEASGCKVEIDDEGVVLIISPSGDKAKIANKMIMDIVQDAEVGKVYDAKIVKIMEFGFFANFLGSRDGLVHISEINEERVNKIEDVVEVGQTVKVKLIGIDNRGKFKLSMKAVNQETGEAIESKEDNSSGNSTEKPNNKKSSKPSNGHSGNKNHKSSDRDEKPNNKKSEDGTEKKRKKFLF